MSRGSAKSTAARLLFIALVFFACCPTADAQESRKKKAPPPQDVVLDPGDGWKLDATYYEGTLGKAAVPFIMIHGWEGRRSEYNLLASGLQQLGHTCLTVDLRGHGGSVRYRTAAGDEKEIEADDLGRRDIEYMVRDIEAAKVFLAGKNDEEKCNLEQLCLVGSGLGSIVCLNYTVFDWPARRPLLSRSADPRFNVKALVLLSPEENFMGLSALPALRHPIIQKQMSILLLAGRHAPGGDAENRRPAEEFKDAKQIYSKLERFRPKLSSREEKLKSQSLFFPVDEGEGLDTSLQGTSLLTPQAQRLNVGQYILGFVNARLVARAEDFPWSERSTN